MTISTNETMDSEEGFDALWEYAWSNFRDIQAQREHDIAEAWERAVTDYPATGKGAVAIAFDGDEAGDKASLEVLLKFMSDSETRRNYLRCTLVNKGTPEQCIRSLTNWELAEELSWWDHCRKTRGAPDWWYDMSQEMKEVCLGEVTRRSRKLNDLGGIEYIKTFNANNTITAILSQYGVQAVPGRTVRCPMHDDTSPSLSVSRDDGRAFCFNQACILWHEGHGVDAFEMNKILSR